MMVTVLRTQFAGTAEELTARVNAFKDALAAHALTIGVPAPREEEWLEALVRSGDSYALETVPAPVVPTFAQLKVAAISEIDTLAEQVRLSYITPGAGQAATYLIKERQAEEFKAAGYTGSVPGMVQAEQAATGLTAQQACDSILAQRDAWVNVATMIEADRRSGKEAIDALADGDTDGLTAARTDALASLEALKNS